MRCEFKVVFNLSVSPGRGRDEDDEDEDVPDAPDKTVITFSCGDAKTSLVSAIAKCLVNIGKHHALYNKAVDDAAARQMVRNDLAVFVDTVYVAAPEQLKLGDLDKHHGMFVTFYQPGVLPWDAW